MVFCKPVNLVLDDKATKRLTKRAIRGIVETVSGQLPATFAEDLLDLLCSRREAPR